MNKLLSDKISKKISLFKNKLIFDTLIGISHIAML